MHIPFGKARQLVKEVPEYSVPTSLVGKLVHLTSNNVKVGILSDPAFNFHVNGSLKLHRTTDYCQWQEYFEDKEDNDGNQYRIPCYFKRWHSHLIPSNLFNLPYHYHNPPRDPYPWHEWVAEEANVGSYTLTKPLIKHAIGYNMVTFHVSETATSEAAQLPKYFLVFLSYMGSVWYKTGIFISAYEKSNGTLDPLFSCTAGDILVLQPYYSV